MTQKKDIGKILRQFGLVFVALFIIVFMSIKSDVFLTSQNIINILRQISINGILAVGMTFVILTGGIDLSVGSVVAITGVIVGSLLQSGTNWFLASLAALVVSAICGVFNGWLISYVGFQPFIATLSPNFVPSSTTEHSTMSLVPLNDLTFPISSTIPVNITRF